MEFDMQNNDTLTQRVDTETPIKKWLVNYVGLEFESRQDTNFDNSVTVEMIVEVMMKQFPEFVLAIAEENFIRGYKQALFDVEYTNNLEEELQHG